MGGGERGGGGDVDVNRKKQIKQTLTHTPGCSSCLVFTINIINNILFSFFFVLAFFFYPMEDGPSLALR